MLRFGWLVLAASAARAHSAAHSHASRGRTLDAADETYAVIAYGRGGYIAGAVVLGSVLRRVDPLRARTALVTNITERAREALLTDGLWDLRESASWERHGVSTSVAWPGRKLDLWALPFRRVLSLDLDLFILPVTQAKEAKMPTIPTTKITTSLTSKEHVPNLAAFIFYT